MSTNRRREQEPAFFCGCPACACKHEEAAKLQQKQQPLSPALIEAAKEQILRQALEVAFETMERVQLDVTSEEIAAALKKQGLAPTQANVSSVTTILREAATGLVRRMLSGERWDEWLEEEQ